MQHVAGDERRGRRGEVGDRLGDVLGLAEARRENSVPRLGEPEDVAEAIAYLASPAASFITGDVLHVSGGRFG